MCSRERKTLKQKDNPISYSPIKDEFELILKEIKLNPSLYRLHSLRSEGASAAANLKDRYISEDLKSLLYSSN